MTDTSAALLADLVANGTLSVEEALSIAESNAGAAQVAAAADAPSSDALTVAEAVELYPVAPGSKFYPKYPDQIASQRQSKMVWAIARPQTWLQEYGDDVNRLEAGSVINALQDGAKVRLSDGTVLTPTA